MECECKETSKRVEEPSGTAFYFLIIVCGGFNLSLSYLSVHVARIHEYCPPSPWCFIWIITLISIFLIGAFSIREHFIRRSLQKQLTQF